MSGIGLSLLSIEKVCALHLTSFLLSILLCYKSISMQEFDSYC